MKKTVPTGWRGFVVCAKLQPNSRGQSKTIELSRPYASRQAAEDFMTVAKRQKEFGMRDFTEIFIVEAVRGGR